MIVDVGPRFKRVSFLVLGFWKQMLVLLCLCSMLFYIEMRPFPCYGEMFCIFPRCLKSFFLFFSCALLRALVAKVYVMSIDFAKCLEILGLNI